MEFQYFLRYKDGAGKAVEEWWGESALSPEINDNTICQSEGDE